MNKKITVSVWLTTVIIAMAVTFSITMMWAMERFDSTVASVQQKELMYSKISEVDTFVRSNDYYDIEETLLQDTIASGYIFGTGDQYAKYYTAEAYTAWLAAKEGKTMGVGLEIAKDASTGYAKVLSVYAGSPAADLGIAPGYYITGIGDIAVKNLATSAQINDALLGESGTTVNIRWLNAAMEQSEGIVTRRNYSETTIAYELVGNHGYIRIRTFAETTQSELDYAISTLQGQGAQTILFDLRNNDGGQMEYALECVSLVFDAGIIANAEYGDGTVKLLGRSYGAGISLPVVCIVNNTTSAGAEAFALGARELGGASLVGSQTAGRGTIQCEPHRFSDGSAVVLTVAKVVTGAGTAFEGTGVVPDVEYVLSPEEQQMFYTYTTETDPQILKANSVADSLIGAETVQAVEQSDSESAQTDANTDADAQDEAEDADTAQSDNEA